MINFRTDLALERRDIFKKANNISSPVYDIEQTEHLQAENLGADLSNNKAFNKIYEDISNSNIEIGDIA